MLPLVSDPVFVLMSLVWPCICADPVVGVARGEEMMLPLVSDLVSVLVSLVWPSICVEPWVGVASGAAFDIWRFWSGWRRCGGRQHRLGRCRRHEIIRG